MSNDLLEERRKAREYLGYTLEPMEHFDRPLGGIAAPLCQSCERRPAQTSRKFSDGDVFLVCADCC